MKKSTLLLIWGILYIICAGLGFIPEPQGIVRAMLFLVSLLFFLPPAVLLYRGKTQRDRDAVRLVRWLSAASLGLTLIGLCGNILAVLGGDELGDIMHILLGLVSAPMFCSNFWVVSLFLWAVLLITSFKK